MVEEVMDHMDMPSYPKTTSTGVAHFIHLNKPLFELLATKTQVYEASTQIMSKVCIAYALLVHIINCNNRFNFHIQKRISIL
jgi:hypothetical protein